MERALLIETLARWLEGKVEATPQHEAEATYCKHIGKEDGRIDWGAGAIELERKLRAFWQWPGCYTTWQGIVLRIIEGAPVGGPAGEPGTVVAVPAELTGGDGRDGVGVVTGEGTLVLRRVQPAGKRQMTAREFIAGRGEFIGARLPS